MKIVAELAAAEDKLLDRAFKLVAEVCRLSLRLFLALVEGVDLSLRIRVGAGLRLDLCRLVGGERRVVFGGDGLRLGKIEGFGLGLIALAERLNLSFLGGRLLLQAVDEILDPVVIVIIIAWPS